jgi:predicted peptidase
MKNTALIGGIALLAFLIPSTQAEETAAGQHPQVFEREIVRTVKFPYLVYLPENYDASGEESPLIVFLHGMGERGDDLERIKEHGPPKILQEKKADFPFVVVSPQCPRDRWWVTEDLDVFLSDILEKYNVDEDRVYLTGLSMGGFATWKWAAEQPERFAAIAPICGGGEPVTAWRLRRMPIWAFHGAKDGTVPLERSEQMIEAVKARGGNPKFTVYPEAEHDSWTETYNNPELYSWFLEHKRGD